MNDHNLQTDALETAQRKYMEQYDTRVGYEYRAAYRNGYDYLLALIQPRPTDIGLSFIHTDTLPTGYVSNTRIYDVNEQAAKKIADKMNDK